MGNLEAENEKLQEMLFLAYEELERRKQILDDNERLESELRAARLKLEKIWRLVK